jgi:uncharacterized membrane protein
MTMLWLGLILFLGMHSVAIVAPGWRLAMVAKLGEKPWKLIYTLVSIVGFVLIVMGYAAARAQPVVLYTPPSWGRHLSMLLLVPVFPLLIAAYTRGRIKAITKHPMLAATKLWAFAHLFSNGTLADVALFGGFLIWAVLDRISLKRRTQVVMAMPGGGMAHDMAAIFGGLALYAWFLLSGHAWLIGVSPLGR